MAPSTLAHACLRWVSGIFGRKAGKTLWEIISRGQSIRTKFFRIFFSVFLALVLLFFGGILLLLSSTSIYWFSRQIGLLTGQIVLSAWLAIIRKEFKKNICCLILFGISETRTLVWTQIEIAIVLPH